MSVFLPEVPLKTGTVTNPIIYVSSTISASATTITFTSGILDKDGNAPTGKFSITAKLLTGDNAGYEETISVPASGLNAAGTVATGVTRGVVVSGRTTTGSGSNTVSLPGGTSTIIDVVSSAQQQQGILDVIDGTIGTGGADFRVGIETDVDITLYFQNADTNKPYIQYDKTLNGFETSVDGSVVETLLTTTALSPGVSDGTALGTTALMWSDLFLASGSVVNFNNGDVTLTHSANTLTLGGGDLALGANNLTMTGSLAATGARVTKGWFTDIESTNYPTISGSALADQTLNTSDSVGFVNTTLSGILIGTPDEITATSTGVAASVTTLNTEVTTNGDSDEDNVTLAAGTSGQVKHIYCVAVGNAADSFKITPATMVGGTQITFAANPLGLGCTLVYADNEGWVVVANNGGTIT